MFFVEPRALGKYRYPLAHPSGLFGITTSEKLPSFYVQPFAEFLHGVGPDDLDLRERRPAFGGLNFGERSTNTVYARIVDRPGLQQVLKMADAAKVVRILEMRANGASQTTVKDTVGELWDAAQRSPAASRLRRGRTQALGFASCRSADLTPLRFVVTPRS